MDKFNAVRDYYNNRGWPWIVTVIIIVIVFIYLLFFKTAEYRASVASTPWTRNIAIESYQVVHCGDWWLPVGAYNVRTSIRIRSYHDVYRTTYYTDSDGYRRSREVFDHSDPVYDTWYDYAINKWVVCRNVVTAGDADRAPYWGEVVLVGDRTDTLGNEREGARTEDYQFVFNYLKNKKDVEVNKSLSFPDWSKAKPGDIYYLKINVVGMIMGDIRREE